MVTSMPSVTKFSGCPGVLLCNCRKFLQSSSCRHPVVRTADSSFWHSRGISLIATYCDAGVAREVHEGILEHRPVPC